MTTLISHKLSYRKQINVQILTLLSSKGHNLGLCRNNTNKNSDNPLTSRRTDGGKDLFLAKVRKVLSSAGNVIETYSDLRNRFFLFLRTFSRPFLNYSLIGIYNTDQNSLNWNLRTKLRPL